ANSQGSGVGQGQPHTRQDRAGPPLHRAGGDDPVPVQKQGAGHASAGSGGQGSRQGQQGRGQGSSQGGEGAAQGRAGEARDRRSKAQAFPRKGQRARPQDRADARAQGRSEEAEGTACSTQGIAPEAGCVRSQAAGEGPDTAGSQGPSEPCGPKISTQS